MSGVIRDTFIALHSSDILRKLEAEVSAAASLTFPESISLNSTTVPRALCKPLGSPVRDSQGVDSKDALGRGLPYHSVQGRGCGTEAGKRSSC